MSIGPSLPPHLTGKRRRSDASASSEESGPSPPSNAQTIVPVFPPSTETESEPSEKRRRLSNDTKTTPAGPIGPALPPPTDEASPTIPPMNDDSDSEDDDDYGPSLPSANASEPSHAHDDRPNQQSQTIERKSAVQREGWMLAPPSGSSLSSLSGPLKARGFASGKAASRPQPGGEGMWTETMAEKQARLKAEVLGTSDPTVNVDNSKIEEEERRRRRDQEMRERVKAYEKESGEKKSLYEVKKGEKEEDDPSKRAFDREKDIGSGELGRKERMAFVDTAKGFGGRFSFGKFL